MYKRQPLGYVDGMSQYRAYFVPSGVDPFGLETMREWQVIAATAAGMTPFIPPASTAFNPALGYHGQTNRDITRLIYLHYHALYTRSPNRLR